MSKISIFGAISGAISAVGLVLGCGLGGLCLYGYISDEIKRKQKESDAERDAEWFAIRRLSEDVAELKLKMDDLEKKIKS